MLTHKLTYDGVLQLTNCFIQLSADVKILSKHENLINFMEFYQNSPCCPGEISQPGEQWRIHLVTSSKGF